MAAAAEGPARVGGPVTCGTSAGCGAAHDALVHHLSTVSANVVRARERERMRWFLGDYFRDFLFLVTKGMYTHCKLLHDIMYPWSRILLEFIIMCTVAMCMVQLDLHSVAR